MDLQTVLIIARMLQFHARDHGFNVALTGKYLWKGKGLGCHADFIVYRRPGWGSGEMPLKTYFEAIESDLGCIPQAEKTEASQRFMVSEGIEFNVFYLDGVIQ